LNVILSTLNNFYTVFQRTWWETKKKIICKKCNCNLSLFHLEQKHKEDYPFLSSEGFVWIKEIAGNYDFIGSLLKRRIDKKDGNH